MSAKFLVILALAVVVSAIPVDPVGNIAYPVAQPAHYDFQYSVRDGQFGDVKQQQEARDGNAVHGSYSLVQPDGVRRIVDYTADKEHGFNAVVRYEGQPIRAPAPTSAAYPAPVANVVQASPSAYNGSPHSQVTYSSPAASYSH